MISKHKNIYDMSFLLSTFKIVGEFKMVRRIGRHFWRLTKHRTFTEFKEVGKTPISTEMSVVLLTKHGTFDKPRTGHGNHPILDTWKS